MSTRNTTYTSSQMLSYACIIEELVAPSYQGETACPWDALRILHHHNQLDAFKQMVNRIVRENTHG